MEAKNGKTCSDGKLTYDNDDDDDDHDHYTTHTSSAYPMKKIKNGIRPNSRYFTQLPNIFGE